MSLVVKLELRGGWAIDPECQRPARIAVKLAQRAGVSRVGLDPEVTIPAESKTKAGLTVRLGWNRRDLKKRVGVVQDVHCHAVPRSQESFPVVGLDEGAWAVLNRWLGRRQTLGLNGYCPVFCTLAGRSLDGHQGGTAGQLRDVGPAAVAGVKRGDVQRTGMGPGAAQVGGPHRHWTWITRKQDQHVFRNDTKSTRLDRQIATGPRPPPVTAGAQFFAQRHKDLAL